MFQIDPGKIGRPPKGPIKHFWMKWVIAFCMVGCFLTLLSPAPLLAKGFAVVAAIGICLWAKARGVLDD